MEFLFYSKWTHVFLSLFFSFKMYDSEKKKKARFRFKTFIYSFSSVFRKCIQKLIITILQQLVFVSLSVIPPMGVTLALSQYLTKLFYMLMCISNRYTWIQICFITQIHIFTNHTVSNRCSYMQDSINKERILCRFFLK